MKQSYYCPYIGLENDAETHLAYPSARNICHRAHPKNSVHPAHQDAYCLTGLHHQCRMFVRPVGTPLPEELRVFLPRPHPTRTVFILLGGLFLALALAVAFGAWGLLATPNLPAAASATADSPADFILPTHPPSSGGQGIMATPPAVEPTHTISPTSSAAPTASSTQTATSLPSASPTPIPSLLSATIGVCTPPAGWVVYVIQPGDTLYQLARTFGVSMAQLQQGNCLISTTLIAGSRIYVPNIPTRTSTTAVFLTGTSTLTPTEALPSQTPSIFPTDIPTFTPLPTHTPVPTVTPTATAAPYP